MEFLKSTSALYFRKYHSGIKKLTRFIHAKAKRIV
jgi:hypothetical protein